MRGASLIAVLCALIVVVVVIDGCASSSSSSSEDVGSSADELNAMDNGAGAAPARYDVDPCERPRDFARDHNLNLIVMQPGVHVMHGTNGPDLIIGTPGDDRIFGEGGDDVICAGGGEDEVHGGPGNDYIDGGSDNDRLFGDEGNDLIHGRGGSDYIFGGNGDDLLFGDILDDHLFGEEGDDLLIGGHGTDVLNGGPGNDYLRGDTGNDELIGGAGTDVVSFMTSMPPGQPRTEGVANPYDGVRVDFSNACTNAPDGQRHDGCANGDGGNEPLDGIEIVIGSPYNDLFVSGGKNVKFIGGWGNDTCNGQPCANSSPIPAAADGKVFVSLAIGPVRDIGLIVRGRDVSDNIEIVQQGDDFKVRSPVGTPLYAGPNCSADGAGVSCRPPGRHVLRYIAAWMADGNDVVKLAEAAVGSGSRRFPIDMTAHVDGGKGDDWLHGGDEEDVFFSGPTGEDHLFGNGGDDALLSESRKWPGKDCSGMTPAQVRANPFCEENKPKGGEYSDGADELFGGPGDDQLVADYPCGKHKFSGGGGKDIAGFARSGRFDLHAQLNGAASHVTPFHGRAFNPQLCGVDHATRMVDDLEILEAADGNDELWGNNANNIIWGREGNDEIHGLGGDDVLWGLKDDDKIFGGGGNDQIQGHSGNNQIFPDAE